MYYDNVKKFNFNEVAGPTLREIEVQKKLQLIQKEWTENKSKGILSVNSSLIR